MKKNLEYIRKEKGVSLTDMADLLDVKSQTIRDKIDGRSDFKFGEALSLHKEFFPEYDMIFLFADSTSSA